MTHPRADYAGKVRVGTRFVNRAGAVVRVSQIVPAGHGVNLTICEIERFADGTDAAESRPRYGLVNGVYFSSHEEESPLDLISIVQEVGSVAVITQ